VRHRGRLLENLRRAETGPFLDEKEFDRKVVAATVKRLVDKYRIRYDGAEIVPSDDDLADRVFQAGVELAVEAGVFCQSTSRRILWTRAEIDDGIRNSPTQATVGIGADTAVVRSRTPEDGQTPMIAGGAYGVLAPEELFIPMMLSYAREAAIDAIDPPCLETAYGMPIKGDSPLEALAGWREHELSMEAARRAGREGISVGCVGLSTTELAQLSATSHGGFRPSDRHYLGLISEFKTNYHMLTKLVHATRIGGLIQSFANPIYGGYVGGAEGVAIALAAGPILLNQLYMATTYGTRPEHPILSCNTTPGLLWAQSVAFQGVSRNTNLMIHVLAGPAGGPGTTTMLLENSALTIAATVSGISMLACSQSASGVNPKHASGLDAKICAEVARAACSLSRQDANDVVGQLVSMYEPDLTCRPIGKPFEEVYDVDTVEPKAEWLEVYNLVKDKIRQMGVKI